MERAKPKIKPERDCILGFDLDTDGSSVTS